MRLSEGSQVVKRTAGLEPCGFFLTPTIGRNPVGAGTHEGAGEGDLLPLAAGELASPLEPFSQLRVVAFRQRVDERRRHPFFRRLLPALPVLEVNLNKGNSFLFLPHWVK